MKLDEVPQHIGKQVTLNGSGDLGIYFDLRVLIHNKTPLTIVKVTKSGRVYLQLSKEFVTVDAANIDLID